MLSEVTEYSSMWPSTERALRICPYGRSCPYGWRMDKENGCIKSEEKSNFNAKYTRLVSEIGENCLDFTDKKNIPMEFKPYWDFWQQHILFDWNNFKTEIKPGNIESIEIWVIGKDKHYISFVPSGYRWFKDNTQETIPSRSFFRSCFMISEDETNSLPRHEVFCGIFGDKPRFELIQLDGEEKALKYVCPNLRGSKIEKSKWKKTIISLEQYSKQEIEEDIGDSVDEFKTIEFMNFLIIYYIPKTRTEVEWMKKNIRFDTPVSLLEVHAYTHLKITSGEKVPMRRLSTLTVEEIRSMEYDERNTVRLTKTTYLIEAKVDDASNYWGDWGYWGSTPKINPSVHVNKEKRHIITLPGEHYKFERNNKTFLCFSQNDDLLILKDTKDWKEPVFLRYKDSVLFDSDEVGNMYNITKTKLSVQLYIVDLEYKYAHPIIDSGNGFKLYSKIDKDNFITEMAHFQHHIWEFTDKRKWQPVEYLAASNTYALREYRVRDCPEMICIMSRDLISEELKEKLSKYFWKMDNLSFEVMQHGFVGILTFVLALPLAVPELGKMLWKCMSEAIKNIVDGFSFYAKQSLDTERQVLFQLPPAPIPDNPNWWEMLIQGSTNLVNNVLDGASQGAEAVHDATGKAAIDTLQTTVDFGLDNVEVVDSYVNTQVGKWGAGIWNKLNIPWWKFGNPETHEIADEAGELFMDIAANITSFGTWIMLAHKIRVTFKRIKKAIERTVLLKRNQWFLTHELLMHDFLFDDNEKSKKRRDTLHRIYGSTGNSILMNEFFEDYETTYKYQKIPIKKRSSDESSPTNEKSTKYTSTKYTFTRTYLDLCFTFANVSDSEGKPQKCAQHSKLFFLNKDRTVDKDKEDIRNESRVSDIFTDLVGVGQSDDCLYCRKQKINQNLAVLYTFELLEKFQKIKSNDEEDKLPVCVPCDQEP